jgi:hypothetical protein
MTQHPHIWVRSPIDPNYEICSRHGCPAVREVFIGIPQLKPPPPPPLPPQDIGYKWTSFQAFMAALEKAPEVAHRIVGLYRRYGPMTDEVLFDHYYREHQGYRNTVLPQRTALNKKGFVINTGKHMGVRSGRRAIVWGLPHMEDEA